MKNRFNKKVAKQIAEKNFAQTLDCVLGRQDPYYDFETPIEDFEQNFTEDLEEMDVIVTPKRIQVINDVYKARVAKALQIIEKLYSKEV